MVEANPQLDSLKRHFKTYLDDRLKLLSLSVIERTALFTGFIFTVSFVFFLFFVGVAFVLIFLANIINSWLDSHFLGYLVSGGLCFVGVFGLIFSSILYGKPFFVDFSVWLLTSIFDIKSGDEKS